MSKQLVLITGATGHLGFGTLVVALKYGYRTRVALRRLEQADKIKSMASIKPYLDSIEFVHVPDITAADAYNEAIKGVALVLHVASPIYSAFDPNDHDWKRLLYDPAVRGTTSILEAASKEPSVKRVVITSSVATLEPKPGSTRAGPYDLKPIPDQQTLDSYQHAGLAYGPSKILAHAAGTEFMQQHKVHFDLIRIMPGYVQGANELYTSAEQMRDTRVLGSNEGVMFTALGIVTGKPRVSAQAFLGDVAEAHVRALDQEKVKGGQNFVVVGSQGDSVDYREFVPIIEKLFPEAVKKGVLSPKVEDDVPLRFFDVASSEQALGMKFSGSEAMVKSLVGQYLRLSGEPEK